MDHHPSVTIANCPDSILTLNRSQAALLRGSKRTLAKTIVLETSGYPIKRLGRRDSGLNQSCHSLPSNRVSSKKRRPHSNSVVGSKSKKQLEIPSTAFTTSRYTRVSVPSNLTASQVTMPTVVHLALPKFKKPD